MNCNFGRIGLAGAASTIALMNASAAYADAFYLHAQSVRGAGRA